MVSSELCAQLLSIRLLYQTMTLLVSRTVDTEYIMGILNMKYIGHIELFKLLLAESSILKGSKYTDYKHYLYFLSNMQTVIR